MKRRAGNQIIKMDNIKHYKHAKLERRFNDNFAPNEIAILGSKCSVITDLVRKIGANLESMAKIAYLDASHNEQDEFLTERIPRLSPSVHGTAITTRAKIQTS